MRAKELPFPKLISTQNELDKLVETLSRQSSVAVDTEANSLYAYCEQVCLIQFSIPGADYLVDPLALHDLSKLEQIFSDNKIEKIFHAAEYDIIMLQHDFQFNFRRLFDTMLAARILGWKSVGLSSILKSQFGVNVNKKFQRADWGQRPLPREMLSYAQLDTHYLISLRERLKFDLIAQNRWELAKEDFCRLSHIKSNHSFDKQSDPWGINGARDLKPQQMAVLSELCHFRDMKARDLDRPLFKVIGDKSLINIATASPDNLKELQEVPGISYKQVRWIGKDIISAIQRGKHKKPPPRPSRKRRSQEFIDRVETLRFWRKTTASKLKVESDVVLPRDLLYDLAEKNPRNQDEMEYILRTVPWRVERFGDEIYDLLKSSVI